MSHGAEQHRPSWEGTVVADRYRVERLLGTGTTGDVYLAQHLALDRPCAIKVLKDTASASRSLAARFRREARAASRLDHPNIVYISDFGRTDDGRLFLVMEYIEGQSLRQALAGGPLSRARGICILRQIALALEAAHEAGVIHRDIKPENILLMPDPDGQETVKILDFSLAKIYDGADLTQLTRKGDLFGTPAYMSPEQARGETVDPRSDIYSLGVLAFEVLTGRLPFVQTSIPAMMMAHRTEQPPPLSKCLRPGAMPVPPALESMVQRCLEKEPDQRPRSGMEIVQVLDAFREAERAPTSILAQVKPTEEPETEHAEVDLRLARRTWARFQAAETAMILCRRLRGSGQVTPGVDHAIHRLEALESQHIHLKNDLAVRQSQSGAHQQEVRDRRARLRYALAELSESRGALVDQGARAGVIEDLDFQIQELERALSAVIKQAEAVQLEHQIAIREMEERETSILRAQRHAARDLVRQLRAYPAALPDEPEIRTEFEDLIALLRLAEEES